MAEAAPEFQADCGRLERRAEDQRGRVERVRLAGAKAALAAAPKPAAGARA